MYPCFGHGWDEPDYLFHQTVSYGREVVLQKETRVIVRKGHMQMVGRRSQWLLRPSVFRAFHQFGMHLICLLVIRRMENWGTRFLQFRPGYRDRYRAVSVDCLQGTSKKNRELDVSVREALSFPGLLSLRQKAFCAGFLRSGSAECLFSLVDKLSDKASIVHYSLLS